MMRRAAYEGGCGRILSLFMLRPQSRPANLPTMTLQRVQSHILARRTRGLGRSGGVVAQAPPRPVCAT